ncbi:unnamed protein product [Paramecium sonneborni]|uniref:Uncharacterized protein n=1 Tax=Paramecium sonneborni TaxID=65129 RepID=A0A8S1QCH4_9CILI|nr:unnamed protein product [Paramecium sonneborni]
MIPISNRNPLNETLQYLPHFIAYNDQQVMFQILLLCHEKQRLVQFSLFQFFQKKGF